MTRQERRYWERKVRKMLEDGCRRGLEPAETVNRINAEFDKRGVEPFDFVDAVVVSRPTLWDASA